MASETTSEERELNELFFYPDTPPKDDRLAFWGWDPRCGGRREYGWRRPTTNEPVELPKNWPPFTWEADGSPIPDGRDEEAVRQWFDLQLHDSGVLRCTDGVKQRLQSNRSPSLDCSAVLRNGERLFSLLRPGAVLPVDLPDDECSPHQAIQLLRRIYVALRQEPLTDTDKDEAGTAPKGKGKNIDARMLKVMAENMESHGWSARQWAEHLDCSDGTVKGTNTWKVRLKAARATAAADATRKMDRTGTHAKGRRKTKHKSDG